jgi:hypothetical protein
MVLVCFQFRMDRWLKPSYDYSNAGDPMGWFWNWWKRPANLHPVGLDVRGKPGERPIVLSENPTDAEIREAVAKWIGQMARGDYALAVGSVFRTPSAPEEFREQVETFFIDLPHARQGVVNALREQGLDVSEIPSPEPPGRAKVIPASVELLERMEIHREGIPENAVAWLGFHVPLDNGCGIWTTMGVMREGDRCILEFEIFHL